MAQKSEVTLAVDRIEATVQKEIKKLGFRKHGRTLCRFTGPEADIAQIINFQIGMSWREETHLLYVNIAIRVPECQERNFIDVLEKKKYYHEYEANIRFTLGEIDGKETSRIFNLKKEKLDEVEQEILDDILNKVIPVFDILNSRENILLHRKKYPNFDKLNYHLILLEETMIYGYLGNIEMARQCFEAYYQIVVDEYEHLTKYGKKQKIMNGTAFYYMGKTYTYEDTDADGYVTVYGASHGHIDYLDELAITNGLR